MSHEQPNELLGLLGEQLLEDERIILCGFRGDPDTAGDRAWKPRPWAPGRPFPFDPLDNVYATVAAFGRAQDGTFRRRVDCFKAGLALMVDDVGTKVDRDQVSILPPTAIVETSPGNEQWWYLLPEPLREPRGNPELTAMERFDALIRGFISKKLLGNDPGMNGVNRVGRLPGFTNGKERHKGFRTRLVSLHPEHRYTVETLRTVFEIPENGRRVRMLDKLPPLPDVLAERTAAFKHHVHRLRDLKMLKADEFNAGGWLPIVCPWTDEHTKRANNGAGISLPNDLNYGYGGFHCHHGHCEDRGWGDLTDWLNEQNVEALNDANRRG